MKGPEVTATFTGIGESGDWRATASGLDMMFVAHGATESAARSCATLTWYREWSLLANDLIGFLGIEAGAEDIVVPESWFDRKWVENAEPYGGGDVETRLTAKGRERMVELATRVGVTDAAE